MWNGQLCREIYFASHNCLKKVEVSQSICLELKETIPGEKTHSLRKQLQERYKISRLRAMTLCNDHNFTSGLRSSLFFPRTLTIHFT